MSTPADFSTAQYTADSELLWMASQGHVSALGYYLPCLAFGWLLIPLVMAAIRFLQIARHQYELTEQRLYERSGILFRRAEVLELYRVIDLSVEQPFLQGLVGSGRVILTTRDSSTPCIVLEAVPDPLAVADLIRDRVERCRVAKGVREFN